MTPRANCFVCWHTFMLGLGLALGLLCLQNIGCFCPEGLVDVAGECVTPSVCHTVCSLPPETGPCR